MDDNSNVQKYQQQNARKSNNNKPKFVVGTASSSTSGRKMRSPPADIFIWGVHPDTTK